MNEVSARHLDMDPIKEEVFMECLWEAITDVQAVLFKQPGTHKHVDNVPFSRTMRLGYTFHLFQIHYLNYWEQHWDSLESGVSYPYTLQETFDRMAYEKIPVPTKELLKQMASAHRICLWEDDDKFIVVPQREVW